MILAEKIEHLENEEQHRFIRGLNRKKWGEKLKGSNAFEVEKLARLDTPTFKTEAGNLNSTPSIPLLNKIKSELRQENDLDENLFTHMEKLCFKYIEDYEKRGFTVVRGYI